MAQGQNHLHWRPDVRVERIYGGWGLSQQRPHHPLDDYQVDIPFAEIEKWPILLATRMNGEYMSIENSGPTRIIFPYHAYPEIDSIKYDDLWVWNIRSMEIN
jgi:hypothetical protein